VGSPRRNDQSTVSGWTDQDAITVADSAGDYTLANTDDQSSVSVSYIGSE
jgi:hypothetical protein